MSSNNEIVRIIDKEIRPYLLIHNCDISLKNLDEHGYMEIEIIGSCTDDSTKLNSMLSYINEKMKKKLNIESVILKGHGLSKKEAIYEN